MRVRALSEVGIEIFASHIAKLRSNEESTLPEDLLTSALTSMEFLPEIEIDENLKIQSFLDLGQHLLESFPQWSWEDCMARQNDNMWAWLSALYFDQLHQPSGGKNPNLCSNQVWHFIPQDKYTVYYRHKARISLALMLRSDLQPGLAQWLLGNSPAKGFSDLLENTVSYNHILKGRGIQRFLLEHYKSSDGGFKANSTSNWRDTSSEKAGANIRRLNVAMKRLDTLADIDEVTSEQIGKLWGAEYSKSSFKIR